MDMFKLAAISAVTFALAGVFAMPASASQCAWHITGTYGTLDYTQSGVRALTKGTVDIVDCNGVFLSFDGGHAIEAEKYFVSGVQLDAFMSDLNYEALTFVPSDVRFADVVAVQPFTLYPRQEAVAVEPQLLLGSPGSLPSGIAYYDGKVVNFVNIEQVLSGPSFGQN